MPGAAFSIGLPELAIGPPVYPSSHLKMSNISNRFLPCAVALALCLYAASVGSQPAHDHAAMMAAKPAAVASPPVTASPSGALDALSYVSVFTRYKSYRDEKTGSWREANETVDRIGGWRAYAKEAQQPDTTAPATSVTGAPSMPESPPAVAPKPDPHAGHGRKP